MYRYFVTICTNRRQAVFEDREAAQWATDQIQQLFEPMQFAVIAFCVMPDHVHLLLEGQTDDADLQKAMHGWKLRTGFAWKQRTMSSLWQEGFYEYVLRDYDSVPSVVRYIIDNPIRAGLCGGGIPYPFVGSSRYSAAELEDTVADWKPGKRGMDSWG